MLASVARQGNPDAPSIGATPSLRDGRSVARAVARGFALLAATLAAGCAHDGAAPACQIETLGVETWDLRASSLTAAYRVRGRASAPAVVSLVAKLAPGDYLTGPSVEVGPGPFLTTVDLELMGLAGLPSELVVLLEVGPRRCSAPARTPT